MFFSLINFDQTTIDVMSTDIWLYAIQIYNYQSYEKNAAME